MFIHTPTWFCFSKREKGKKNIIILLFASQAYLCIQVLHCFEKSCNHVPFFLIIEKSKKQQCLYSLSLSWTLPLFVSPKGTVYAPYPSLLCARLLRFQSIPPHCLLSPSIVPINYSTQSLPPTEGMSPPPLEMNDWQVCSVSNIPSDNRREGNGWVFSHWGNCRRQRMVKKSGRAERKDIIYNITACFCSCDCPSFK